MAKRGDRFKVTSLLPQTEPITVIFTGMQQTGFDEIPPFPLYDLIDDLPGHPAGSTLSRETIEEFGFLFPNDAP